LRGNIVGETANSGPVPTGGPQQYPEFQGFAQNNPVGDLTAADVTNNPDTINNTRLWDVRPLLQAYQQLQGLRSYYVLGSVDVDRYGGQQVMLSARELDVSRLPPQAQTSAHG